MSDYVPVGERWMRLEGAAAETEALLRSVDPALRLRKSIDHPGFAVLERRRVNTPTTYAPESAHLTDAKVTARDGYVHVSHVHPVLMENPAMILQKLRENHNDLGAAGNSAAQWWVRFRREEQDAKEARSRQRAAEFTGRARDAYDLLDRVGNSVGAEKIRINNAGFPRTGVVLTDAAPSLTGEPAVHGGQSDASHEFAPTAGQ